MCILTSHVLECAPLDVLVLISEGYISVEICKYRVVGLRCLFLAIARAAQVERSSFSGRVRK